MNQKEVSEIRRRFRADRSNITKVAGVYVSDTGEILARFSQSVGLMLEDEKEKLLGVLKRTLSGGLGKNLLDLSIPTQEVAQGDKHKLLMKLRDSQLEDQEALEQFCQKIIETVTMETNYVILLACDNYDVPHKGRDALEGGESDQVYRYLLTCVCPVKLTKSNLSFQVKEGEFHNSKTDWVVGAPELGFLFPAFDSRATNLYGALLYSRRIADNHEDLIQAVFGAEPPMAAAAQRETFQSILGSSLEHACSLEVVKSVHAQLRDMIEEHKQSGEKEQLVISKPEVNHVLKTSGLSEAQVAAFDADFDETFGAHADLNPGNLVDAQRLEILTPDVKIHVTPDKQDLIETRVLGGAKYILIRAEEGVEVNGVPVEIQLP